MSYLLESGWVLQIQIMCQLKCSFSHVNSNLSKVTSHDPTAIDLEPIFSALTINSNPLPQFKEFGSMFFEVTLNISALQVLDVLDRRTI